LFLFYREYSFPLHHVSTLTSNYPQNKETWTGLFQLKVYGNIRASSFSAFSASFSTFSATAENDNKAPMGPVSAKKTILII